MPELKVLARTTKDENTEGGHGGAAKLKQSAIQQAMKYVFFWQKIIDKQC